MLLTLCGWYWCSVYLCMKNQWNIYSLGKFKLYWFSFSIVRFSFYYFRVVFFSFIRSSFFHSVGWFIPFLRFCDYRAFGCRLCWSAHSFVSFGSFVRSFIERQIESKFVQMNDGNCLSSNFPRQPQRIVMSEREQWKRKRKYSLAFLRFFFFFVFVFLGDCDAFTNASGFETTISLLLLLLLVRLSFGFFLLKIQSKGFF